MQMPEDVQDATLDDINRNKVTRFNHAALFVVPASMLAVVTSIQIKLASQPWTRLPSTF